jgi:tripartite-type tricarboxylate transporter receptor subunit TctC
MIRNNALCFFVLALSLAAADPAWAQDQAKDYARDYPNKSVRLVVPYPPGGGMDVTGRILADRLGAILGQQFVVEDHPGASGTIGAEAVARGAHDGYTLLLCPSDFSTAPSLLPQLNFDPSKELVPIAMVSDNPILVVANANAPFNDLKGMLATAKANPNGLDYATPGSGSLNHVIGEWIGVTAHIKVQQVPYKGGVEAADAVASGDIPIGILSTPSVYPALIDAGKVKVIALTGKRSPSLPASWPTLVDGGLPIEATIWIGIFAPASTPQPIVAKLDQAIGQALKDGLLRKRMDGIGFSPEYLGQTAFAVRIDADRALYEPIIQQSGIAVAR